MNKKVLQTLEYEKVKDQLYPFIQTEQGQVLVDHLQPSSDFDQVSAWLQETNEAVLIDRLKGGMLLPALVDIKDKVRRLEIQASLNGAEIVSLAQVLTATAAIAHFFENIQDDDLAGSVDRLAAKAADLVLLPELTAQVNKAIDETGQVLDSASSALASLRRRMTGHENAIRQKLQGYTRGSQLSISRNRLSRNGRTAMFCR